MQRKLVIIAKDATLGNMDDLMNILKQDATRLEVAQKGCIQVEVEPAKVVFTKEEWEIVTAWTGEHPEQDQMLACGAEGVTSGIAVSILAEMLAESGMQDEAMNPVIAKLGLLISQFPN